MCLDRRAMAPQGFGVLGLHAPRTFEELTSRSAAPDPTAQPTETVLSYKLKYTPSRFSRGYRLEIHRGKLRSASNAR